VRVGATLNLTEEPVEWLILNAEADVEVDLTSVDPLDEVREELTRRDIVLALARVKQDLRDDLASSGLPRPRRGGSCLPNAATRGPLRTSVTTPTTTATGQSV